MQAFDDINKRTSRVSANVPLLKADLAPMSFVTMDDRDYIDGLIGVYELNNVSLLRDAYIDAYKSSADNYKTVRAELDSPEKPALAYRGFVREAVRRSVLDWKSFQPEKIRQMAVAAEIPETDHQQVIDYIGREFHGLHEGNLIRYRLRLEDMVSVSREDGRQ